MNSDTGLSEDTSRTLGHETVYVAGNEDELPNPPTTTDSLADADAVLATPTANRAKLARAFRAGKPVAVAGDGATTAVRGLLDSVREDYSFGVETVNARPVKVAVVKPRGDTVETFTFVAEGGWDDPILDPFGWALVGRVPDCDTFVPKSSADSMFEYAGAAYVVGRLPTGETYASRSAASVARQDGDLFIRLRTRVHAAANDGYAVENVVREADFPNDQRIGHIYPGGNTRNGVQLTDLSDPIVGTFEIKLMPENPRAHSALTGCGGLQTRGNLAYDHRTSFQWKHDKLLGSDHHYGGGTGRGEWSFHD